MTILYGESDKSTNVTPARVPELVGVQPAGSVVLTRWQWHRSAQPGSSTGTLPPAALCPAASHITMTALSPAWEQPQSDSPALLHFQAAPRMWPTITVTVLAGLKKLQPLQARQELQDDCSATGLLISPATT